MTVAFFALAVIAGTTLDDSTSSMVGLALFAAFVAYCVAREAGGSDLFWMAAAPNVLSIVPHDAFGIPRWLAILLLPLVFWGAWRIDHHPRGEHGPDVVAPSSIWVPRSGGDVR